MEQKNKLTGFGLVKFAFYFLIFVLLFRASIFSAINPFYFATLFAFVWAGQNVFLLSGSYVLAAILTFNKFTIFESLISVLILILVALIHKRAKKKICLSLLCFYMVLSQASKFIFFKSKFHLLFTGVELILGVIILCVLSTFFQALLQRKTKLKLNTDEMICSGVFLLGLACGLANLNLYGINIGLMFATFLLLICLAACSLGGSLIVATIIGGGYFLVSLNISYLFGLILFSLFAGMFVSANKYFAVISGLLIESVLGFYFQIYPNYSALNFLIIAFACLMFLLLSSKTISHLKRIIGTDKSDINNSSIVEISNKLQYAKLNEISKTLFEMDKAYKNMLKKTLSQEEACFMLAEELKERNCSDCPNKNVCFRKSGEDMLNHFCKLFDTGINKKQVGIVDLPYDISTKCLKKQHITSSADALVSHYLEYYNMLKGVNSSRLLISNQMASVAKLLKQLASETKENLVYNHDLEKELENGLVYENLTSVSGVIAFTKKDSLSVIISMLKAVSDKEQLEKIVSKCCKIKMEIKEEILEEGLGVISYLLVPSARCELVLGCAKAGANDAGNLGDVYGAVKVDGGKYLLTICDGMGMGKGAGEISGQTIELIENYYKAGFESESIISNINKLFVAGNEEKFSTLDVCVLDLNSLKADFIKMGAPETFIKSGKETKIVSFGNLPIGAVEEVQPKLESKNINPKDIIFMLSDGVSDCFEDESQLANIINNLKGNNPQMLAEQLLNLAIAKNKGAINDDMTVFVSRVFSKY